MPAEMDSSAVEALRGLANLLLGARHFMLAVAATLQADPEVRDDEAPEEGVAYAASCLRCLVNDAIEPALRRLEALIEECAPQGPSSEPTV
jgi:hypothetical protein